MKKSNIRKSMRLSSLFVCCLFGFMLHSQSSNIQLITSAPLGEPGEPTYSLNASSSVGWLSEAINGNYYLGALSPTFSDEKTIAIYQFIAGSPPSAGMLEFVAAAPTGQCIFDQFTQQDICDDSNTRTFFPQSLDWFPGSIYGEYFFIVVGRNQTFLSRLGLQNQQNIRVYRFNPSGGTTPIEFIDSAPLQFSENEPPLQNPSFVSWLPFSIEGNYYFSVVGVEIGAGSSQYPQVRVYSFNPKAPLGNNISWVGAAANDTTNPLFSNQPLSVDWVPRLIHNNSYFAVGGASNADQVRVYRFCVNPCEGTAASQENHVQLITTAPTTNRLDSALNRADSVKWLVANDKYYLAVAVEEDLSSPFTTERSVRIYEFSPNQNNPSQGSLRFVASAPTGKMCCADQTIDNDFTAPLTLDWLVQDGRFFLLVGGGLGIFKKVLSSNSIRVYEFNSSKEQLSFIAGEELFTDISLSLDWFPGLIEKNNYFAAGISDQFSSGTKSSEVRIFKFRPPCSFAGLSCNK